FPPYLPYDRVNDSSRSSCSVAIAIATTRLSGTTGCCTTLQIALTGTATNANAPSPRSNASATSVGRKYATADQTPTAPTVPSASAADALTRTIRGGTRPAAAMAAGSN